jgi:hypothetical protein
MTRRILSRKGEGSVNAFCRHIVFRRNWIIQAKKACEENRMVSTCPPVIPAKAGIYSADA